ncbi:adenylosuccinate lyase [Thermogemmatispora onikobensis]|uniref:adenylosuccinate lyase n=1 Tax=Thermogemmatispora onikobensis TaxID=732234 RepID=UPI0008536200|nr:adenylosuccinate lyase [Thermogemmatispora onikobensis]
MGAHLIDSTLFGDQFGTEEMRRLFDDRAMVRAWMEVEAALAWAEAEVGLIPREAAQVIAERVEREQWDFEALARGIAETFHPLVPAIRVLSEACGEAGAYVHWGATTQDIMDTGLILQLREALALLEERMLAVRDAWRELAIRYRDTLMPGRTHGQHGPPITFGFKAAIWVAEMNRHLERLRACKPRLLVGQLAGATGSLASLGDHGLEVQRLVMQRLGLNVPPICWHTARDNLAEFVGLLGLVCATLGKVAMEIIHLQATEVAEVEEPFIWGKVGSSTMPHKRNPMICELIAALGRIVRQDAALALDTMVQEHERDMAAWQAEWEYIPRCCILTDSALVYALHVARDLSVNAERMRANIELTGGLALSEAVMLQLGRFIGRQKAHDVVYRIAMAVASEGKVSFSEALQNDREVQAYLSPEQIRSLLEPEHYLGSARASVDRVVALTLPLSEQQEH